MNIILRIVLVYLVSILLFIPWIFLLPKELQPLLLTTAVLKTIFSGIMLIFLLAIIEKYREYRSKPIIYLFFAGFLYFLSYVLEFISIYFLNIGDQFPAEVLYIAGQIAVILSPVTIILFLSDYRTNRVNPIHLFPTTFALGMLCQEISEGKSIIHSSFIQNGVKLEFISYNQDSAWYYIGFIISFLYILLYTIYSTYKLNKQTYEKEIKRQQKIFLTGILLAVGLTPLIFVLIYFIPNAFIRFTLIFSVTNSFAIIAISLTLLPYLNNQNPGYLQPQPIEHLIVIQKNGILLLSISFSSQTIDDVLFSGAVSAVSSIMKEATGTLTEIRKIEFEDKTLLTRFRDSLGFILIAGYETNALSDYIENYSQQFLQQFNVEVDQAIANSLLLDSVEILAFTKKSFGLPVIS